MWPLAVRAQLATPVIGFLNITSQDASVPLVAAFRQGLRRTGYVEGQNVSIKFRWGENDNRRLPELAADLVRLPANVIVASGGDQAVQSAKAATSTIPIVATLGNDPVRAGLVSSLNRSGGNITGVSVFAVQLLIKRLELAGQFAGPGTSIAFLFNPSNPNASTDKRELEEAAATRGQGLLLFGASTGDECDAAIAGAVRQKCAALIVESDSFFNGQAERLVALAHRHAIPVVYPRREFVMIGGLLSYGTSLTEAFRQVGDYAGRILKGERPSDLPILLPTRFDLVLNIKTANALGLKVPTTLLVAADEVIE